MNVKEIAKKCKQDLPIIYFVFKNNSTPLFSKLLAGITIGYALSPIDLIPDFIPILGYLDDLILLPFLITMTMKSLPESIIAEARKSSIDFWEKYSKKWYYAIPIVLLWVLLIFVVIEGLL